MPKFAVQRRTERLPSMRTCKTLRIGLRTERLPRSVELRHLEKAVIPRKRLIWPPWRSPPRLRDLFLPHPLDDLFLPHLFPDLFSPIPFTICSSRISSGIYSSRIPSTICSSPILSPIRYPPSPLRVVPPASAQQLLRSSPRDFIRACC
jgi:hypothetical protein